MRNKGIIERNPLEVRCGREIDNNFINKFQELEDVLLLYYNKNALSIFTCMAINLHRIRLVDFPKYVNVVNDNSDLRIRYLMAEISEEQFKCFLQKRDKENRKFKRLSQILNMYIDCSTEIFYRIINYITIDVIDKVQFNPLREFRSLINYTNECLEDIKQVYKCKSYIIEDDGFFTRG